MALGKKTDDWKVVIAFGILLMFTGIGIPFTIFLVGYGFGLRKGRKNAENGEYETIDQD